MTPYITAPLHHLLLQPHVFPVGQVFLPHLRLLTPGRYCRRWARRLREEGFSPEDALMVSHASFGVDIAGQTFGAEAVLTTDYALKARFEQRFSRLSTRLERMTRQLRLPYRGAALPAVLRPEELLELLQG